jgi:hypothetical protein
MSKMGSHCSFGHLKHKLRPKERPGVKTGSQIANLTPDQKKLGIDPIYFAGCRRRATYRWKDLDESYNFASDRVAIRGLLTKLFGFKVTGVLSGAVSGLPRGSPETKRPFRCGPRGEVQSIL